MLLLLIQGADAQIAALPAFSVEAIVKDFGKKLEYFVKTDSLIDAQGIHVDILEELQQVVVTVMVYDGDATFYIGALNDFVDDRKYGEGIVTYAEVRDVPPEVGG